MFYIPVTSDGCYHVLAGLQQSDLDQPLDPHSVMATVGSSCVLTKPVSCLNVI